MRLSYITDEVTQDLAEAIACAKRWDLQGVELRTVEDTAIDEIPGARLKEYKKMLDAQGLAVSDLASSFYKCPMEDTAAVEGDLEKLKRLLEAADILDCPSIRGFAFIRPEDGTISEEAIIEAFRKPAEVLRAGGRKLLLESDPSVTTYNHKRLAALLRRLDAPCFGAIYDPGNDIYDEIENETPYPDGYTQIKPYIAHVHVKDAMRGKDNKPFCVKPGTGWVDYPGLLHALASDGYDGWYSLETHYRKKTELHAEAMRFPGGSAFSEGGLEATAESMEAFKKLQSAEGRSK